MYVSLELIFDSLGLDHPLIGSIPVHMNKLSCFIAVNRLDLIIRICDVWALDLEALNKHFQWRNTKRRRRSNWRKKQRERWVVFVACNPIRYFIGEMREVGVTRVTSLVAMASSVTNVVVLWVRVRVVGHAIEYVSSSIRSAENVRLEGLLWVKKRHVERDEGKRCLCKSVPTVVTRGGVDMCHEFWEGWGPWGWVKKVVTCNQSCSWLKSQLDRMI